MNITIRLATEADLSTIVQWRQDATAWLVSIGSDQWSGAGIDVIAFTTRVRISIAEGGTWIAEVEGQPAATVAIDDHCDDPELWTPAEQAESVIVHRMMADQAHRRRGLGAVLLDHADWIARQYGKRWVRLDAWTTNTRLHDYYRQLGFRLVRVSDPTWVSAALFERPVSTDQQPSDSVVKELVVGQMMAKNVSS